VSETESNGAFAGARLAPDLELTARPCPVCGVSDANEVAPARVDWSQLGRFAFASRKRPEYMHFRLLECRRCAVLYASPAPTAAALERAYRAASFAASSESRYAARTYGSLLKRFAAGLPDREGALDIGTGDGAFLEQLLEQGFHDVVGLELSEAPVQAAGQAVAALIRQAAFRSGDFAAEQFRLVTCFQTTEHVLEPLELCREAHRILKPGGVLFLVCHNRRAALARLLGRRSPIFDVEHLQLFCLRSIRALLERAGFRQVTLRSVVNRYPLSYWARLVPAPARSKDVLLRALSATRLGRLPIAAPVGNLAAIAYK
jgi:SAM-dependent methyltransferase